MKCNDCYLRHHCDEQTEFICKFNDYCKYMPEQNTENQNSKRLTKSGVVSQKDINKLLEPSNENQFGMNNAYYKLKEYEDTGLTPQEIEQMKAKMPLHQWAGESPDKMSIFGVSVAKIMELVEAEKNNIRTINDIVNAEAIL